MKEEEVANRSVEKKEMRYPCYGWRQALRIANSVRVLGGAKHLVPRASLAKALEMEIGPAFSQLLSASKAFGLIEGNKAYSLTEPGKRYFHPTSDLDKRRAALSCFNSSLAFQTIIDRFDGQSLPSTDMLGNVLLHGGIVPTSWARRVASIFITSANDLSLIDQSGILRFRAAEYDAEEPSLEPAENLDTTRHSEQAQNSVVSDTLPIRDALALQVKKPGANVWFFTEGGGTVKLETPNPLPRALWERLRRYVEVLEPAEAKEES